MGLNALAPWQEELFLRLSHAASAGRLGHALLLSGPPRLGKRAVAAALAARLLCSTPHEARACGTCRACVLGRAGHHPDLRTVAIEANEKTGRMRSEILVDQVRQLAEWFSLTPQLGGAQVAIVESADALGTSAANALLKTLEEPHDNRYLLLASDRPQRLAATIRSRCQRYALRLPDEQAGLDWLTRRGVEDPASALAAADGNPGLAEHWAQTGIVALREGVKRDLEALAARRADLLGLARAWVADEHGELRIALAADLARSLCAARLRGGHVDRLTATADLQKLSAWYEAANRVRGLMAAPVRGDLAVAGLLRDWRAAFSPP